MMAWMSAALAAAGEGTCARSPIAPAELAADGANGLQIKGIVGSVVLVPSSDARVHVSGTSCSEAGIKLVRRDGVIVATARVPQDAELELTLAVPPAVGSLSVYGHTGPVRADGLDAKIAVISSTGPVDVRGGETLRVAYTTGPVRVQQVRSDVVIEKLDGSLHATAIGGNVVADDVSGGVTVDDVSGNLAVTGGGPVNQHNVRGVVTLP